MPQALKPAKPYAALPLLWAAVMLVLTLTPANEMPVTPAWKLLSFDTAAHAGVFAVLAVLSWFSLRRQRRWPVLAQQTSAVVVAGCIFFGALIEVLQYAMHLGRQAELSDLVSDSIGGLAGVVFMLVVVRRWPALAGAAVLAVLLGPLSAGHAQAQPEPDAAQARRIIAALAAPKLHGRGYVRQGEHQAAAYLRRQLRQLGLQPLAPDYYQPFVLAVNTFPGQFAVAFRGPGLAGTGLVLPPGPACIAAPASAGAANLQARLLPLDTLVFHVPAAAQRLAQTSVRDRALLLRPHDAERLAALPTLQQHLDSAAAWVTLVPKLTASLAGEQAPQPRLEVLATPATAQLTAADVLHLRLAAELKRRYQTQNLAAVVRGRTQPDSFLVVSAHYDHLGTMGRNAYFPGANDNASGVALLLALATHYARPENQPACSVAFLLFGAEEAGLVGSRYFVAHPLVPLPRIKFLVNLDLLGTGEQGATIVNGRVHEAAYQRLVALNAAHRYLPALAARGRAANSDHFPFSEAGVPAFFMYTRGGSTAYHDVHDQPGALSLAGFAGAFGLVRDFLDGLGGQ